MFWGDGGRETEKRTLIPGEGTRLSSLLSVVKGRETRKMGRRVKRGMRKGKRKTYFSSSLRSSRFQFPFNQAWEAQDTRKKRAKILKRWEPGGGVTGRDLVYLVCFSPPPSSRTSFQAKQSVCVCFFCIQTQIFLFFCRLLSHGA